MLYTPHLSPDGSMVAVVAVKVVKKGGKEVGDGSELCIWEVKTGNELKKVREDGTLLGFSADGEMLVQAQFRTSSVEELTYRNSTTGDLLASRKPIKDVIALCWSADRKSLVLVGKANNEDKHPVEIRDAKTDKAVATLTLPKMELRNCRLSPDGKTLMAAHGARNGPFTIATWDVATGKQRTSKEIAELTLPLVSEDARLVFAKNKYQHGILLDSSGKVRMSIPFGLNMYRFTPSGRWLICGTSTRQILLVDLKTFKIVRSMKTPLYVDGFDLSADGKFLVVAGRTDANTYELQQITLSPALK
jgi:WD40 repeat protein